LPKLDVGRESNSLYIQRRARERGVKSGGLGREYKLYRRPQHGSELEREQVAMFG